MAKYMSKDQLQELNEGRAFLTELKQFHQSHGAPFRRLPIINGHEIDLFKLYNEVTTLGGWSKIIDLSKWEDISVKLGLPKHCANSSILLKHIYIRYLNKYERIHFHGEEADEEVAAESRSSRKSHASLTSMVPMVYHHHQHDVPDQMRNVAGLSIDRYIPTGYEKLCLSLLSSLPNEVDLALNTITLLSSRNSGNLPLSKTPKLIDLLLAHAGIYSEADRGLQNIIEEGWPDIPGGNLSQFWIDTIDCADVELAQILNDNVCLEEKFEKYEEADEDLFCVNRNLGCHDREGQRILRIALILKNLSFGSDNAVALASNSRFLRFLLLCTNSKWSELKTVGYDTLGNVSQEIVLRSSDHSTRTLVLRTIVEAITSQDRFLVISGLEMVSKLCQCEGNDEVIFKSLDSQVYESLCNYLTVRDICLLVYTLEALYQLTELGEDPCSGFANVHKSIEILMNLLTVDPQLYGKEALQGMKLISIHDPQDINVTQPSSVQVTNPPPNTPQRVQPPTILTNASLKQCSPNIAKLTPSFKSQPVDQHEMENYVCNWLRTYLEMEVGNLISKQEVYNDFVSYSFRSGHKAGLPNQVNFSNFVRHIFPHSAERKCDDGKGNIVFCFEGIKRKSVPTVSHHPLTISLPPSPTKTPPPNVPLNHSPILKAHLNAPPKGPLSPNSKTPNVVQQSQVKGSKSASSMITTTPVRTKEGNNTTLIKSLLANKVNRNIHQRQQLMHDIDTPIKIISNATDQNQFHVNSGLKAKPNHIKKISKETNGNANANKSKATVLLAAKLNGVQKNVENSNKVIEGLEKTHNLMPVKVNGTASEDEKPPEGCDQLIRSVTANLPSVENKEQEQKRREKICKSSPLLNGLLDKGKIPQKSNDVLEEKLNLKPVASADIVQNGSTIIEDESKQEIVEKPVSNVVTNVIFPNSTPVVNTSTDTLAKVLESSEIIKVASPALDSAPVVNSTNDTLAKAIENSGAFEQNADSNMSNSDLSSLSDIARTVESASVVINQTSANPEALKVAEKDIKTPATPVLVTGKSVIAADSTPTVTIPIVTNAMPTSQTCIQFVPVLTSQSKIQLISQNNLSLCFNIIQPADQINISNTKAPSLQKPQLQQQIIPQQSAKRALMPSAMIPDSKKQRIDCSNIIKLEPTSDDKGVIIIENGILRSRDEVTLKTGQQNNAADVPSYGNDKNGTKSKELNKVVGKSDDKKPVDDKKKKVGNEQAKLEYTCEWQGCGKTFDTPVAVYLHACEIHAPIVTSTSSIPCMWDKCDKQPRKRLSLMTHLQDRHCNEQFLKINALRKQQIVKTGKTNIPIPQPPPAHPGYPPNAAFHAIRRHALQFVCASDVISENNEDVLAKSVRLSSALILRNIARYSPVGRRRVKCYESKISLLALSKTESSQTLTQCLSALISTSIEHR